MRTPTLLLCLVSLNLLAGCAAPTERADSAPAKVEGKRVFVQGGLGSRIPRKVTASEATAANRGSSPEAQASGEAVRDVMHDDGMTSIGVGETGP